MSEHQFHRAGDHIVVELLRLVQELDQQLTAQKEVDNKLRERIVTIENKIAELNDLYSQRRRPWYKRIFG